MISHQWRTAGSQAGNRAVASLDWMGAAACLLGTAWSIVDNHTAPGGRRDRALLLRVLQLGTDRAQLVQEQPGVGALLIKVGAGEEAGCVLQRVVDLLTQIELFHNFIFS